MLKYEGTPEPTLLYLFPPPLLSLFSLSLTHTNKKNSSSRPLPFSFVGNTETPHDWAFLLGNFLERTGSVVRRPIYVIRYKVSSLILSIVFKLYSDVLPIIYKSVCVCVFLFLSLPLSESQDVNPLTSLAKEGGGGGRRGKLTVKGSLKFKKRRTGGK